MGLFDKLRRMVRQWKRGPAQPTGPAGIVPPGFVPPAVAVSPAVVAAVAVAADAIVRPTQVAELTAYQAGEPYIEVTEAGPALEKLQELLRALGETVELPEPNGTGGRQYGWYGPLTGAAVQKYQRAGGLPVTGQVTPELWRYMRSLPR